MNAKSKPPCPAPRPAQATLRQAILAALLAASRGAAAPDGSSAPAEQPGDAAGQGLTSLELSAMLGCPERRIVEELPHVARSLHAEFRGRHRGQTLKIRPAKCLGCGHVFADRQRFSRPGKCPNCKGGHIAQPSFFLF